MRELRVEEWVEARPGKQFCSFRAGCSFQSKFSTKSQKKADEGFLGDAVQSGRPIDGPLSFPMAQNQPEKKQFQKSLCSFNHCALCKLWWVPCVARHYAAKHNAAAHKILQWIGGHAGPALTSTTGMWIHPHKDDSSSSRHKTGGDEIIWERNMLFLLHKMLA